MTKKIFRSILWAVILGLAVSFSVVTAVLYSHFARLGAQQLDEELSITAAGVELGGFDYFEKLSLNSCRVTWVAADGSVIYDSQADAASLDNHMDREEIREAFAEGRGESSRYSDTLTLKMLYSARRLSDGTVLRMASSHDSVFALFFDMLLPMAAIILLSAVLSAFLARRMAAAIVKPLNEINLEQPERNDTYEELSPMLGKIKHQHEQIAMQMKQLRYKAEEFEQITASMNEGLILLDKNGLILSINPAACRVFGLEGSPVGQDLLTVDRSPRMSEAVKNALSGGGMELREQRAGREYQFDISCIESGGKTAGAVILCFDITESAHAEQKRREFSANVSHELKTPLQSIIGSAELLENGLVKPEDTARFVGNIRSEAQRLVSLINDIIRLSQLDEGGEDSKENVELGALAREIVDVLRSAAEKKQVLLSLDAERCTIKGVKRYLYEIIYNLCDNAIHYNLPGGTVDISIKAVDGETVLTVSDTGIGIPPEHQSRIFERFYRVDKSHSRETGGTGLGLSIVKHAVSCHGGRIELDSTEGKGTTIRVIFK